MYTAVGNRGSNLSERMVLEITLGTSANFVITRVHLLLLCPSRSEKNALFSSLHNHAESSSAISTTHLVDGSGHLVQGAVDSCEVPWDLAVVLIGELL